ncbi:MAG: glycosyltransferase family 2 protein [Thermoanaerobaculia bacterium]
MGTPDTLPLAVVVVNLEGGAMLDACLDAVEAQHPADTIVVDNGSSAPELARLAQRAVHVIGTPQNQGFAEPCNRGVREAGREGRAPRYVAVVNNDCTLAPGYLAACVAALDADEGLAAVQGVVLDAAGSVVDGCGIGWNARAEAIQLRRGEVPPSAEALPFSIPGVSATAAVYRRDVFLACGGFEESFFAYYEDVDLSLRLARQKLRFACVPAARARHLGSATGGRWPEERWRRLLQNRLRTLRRNLSPQAKGAAFKNALVPGSLRAAAREIGWLSTLSAAAAAGFESAETRRRDVAVLAAFPPLTKLPA